jgi:hypothetical protein
MSCTYIQSVKPKVIKRQFYTFCDPSVKKKQETILGNAKIEGRDFRIGL